MKYNSVMRQFIRMSTQKLLDCTICYGKMLPGTLIPGSFAPPKGAAHGSGLKLHGSGQVGSGKVDPTRPNLRELGNLLSRIDPTRLDPGGLAVPTLTIHISRFSTYIVPLLSSRPYTCHHAKQHMMVIGY